MAEITLRGRTIPLTYTTYEMKTIQEEIGPLGDAIATALGRNPEDEEDLSRFGTAEHLDAMGKMAKILGNAGLEESGEKGDLTVKWILRSMRQQDIIFVTSAIADTLLKGVESEIPREEEAGPVDVVLEEIEKKKEATS